MFVCKPIKSTFPVQVVPTLTSSVPTSQVNNWLATQAPGVGAELWPTVQQQGGWRCDISPVGSLRRTQCNVTLGIRIVKRCEYAGVSILQQITFGGRSVPGFTQLESECSQCKVQPQSVCSCIGEVSALALVCLQSQLVKEELLLSVICNCGCVV